MPLPLIIPIVFALGGALGIGKSIKAMKDTSDAKSYQFEAEEIVKTAKAKLRKQQRRSGKTIDKYAQLKINAMTNEIQSFINLYERIKAVNLQDSPGLNELGIKLLNREGFEQLRNYASKAREISTDSSGMGMGLAGGATAGTLTALGAYGFATTFGVASTGTAITSLSGVAATNATLAWLGGGTLAAGGLGMAGATLVLGGLVAGPLLLVSGFVVGANAKKRLNNALSNNAEATRFREEVKTVTDVLENIIRTTKQLHDCLEAACSLLANANQNMSKVVYSPYLKYNWQDFSQSQKETVFTAVKAAQLVKVIVDTPILDEDGTLTQAARSGVRRFPAQLRQIEQ